MTQSSTNVSGNEMNTAFVTGGTGLVGSHLIKKLVQSGFTVKALYRTSIPSIDFSENVQWVKGDLFDIPVLEEAIRNVQYVFHCAAMVSYNPRMKQTMFKTNIEGTANIVNACLLADDLKLCYVSSVAALGKSKAGVVLNENTDYNEIKTDSNYGKSKYLAEMEVWRGIGEGLQAVIVNPSIILGAGDWNDSSAKIFKTAYDEFPWYAEGITGFVDVEDVVNIMLKLTMSDVIAQRFILSAENRTFKSVFTEIGKCFGKKSPHKKVTPFLAGVIWRIEKFKSLFSNADPLLTKETADAALTITKYDNEKLKKYFPDFSYTPVDDAIKRICKEYIKKYNLS